MNPIIYKNSKVYFMDCLEGMKDLPDLSFDLCLTDPPFNNKTGQYNGFIYNNRPERIIYEDYREDYLDWCKLWFKEISRISKTQLIFCGLNNLAMWFQNFPVKDLLVVYKPFSGFGSRIATFSNYTPVVCLGEITQQLNSNVVLDDRNDYTKETWIHPHPKNPKSLKKIIKESKAKTVIDPFLGSGTTLQATIELDIDFLGFELREDYAPDILKRIEKGKKIRKQKPIFDFIN